MRKHGFQYPPDNHQVIAVLLFSVLVAGFFLFSSWQLHTLAARIGVTASFGAATLFTLFLGVLTARIDAGDPGIRQQHTAELTVVNQQPKYICTICQVVVQPRSKQCRKCDKCVQDFDHHCIWLNNCIGKANYGSFMCLLTATLVLLLFQAAVNIILLATSFTNPAAASNRQHYQFSGGISLTGYRVAWIAFLAAPMLLALLVGELLVFHLVLQWRGMSTYDYILAQREKHSSQRLPKKVSPEDPPPSSSLIMANTSALDPDGEAGSQTVECAEAEADRKGRQAADPQQVVVV
ncbi:hypothetical protein WJX84_004259 [Apatococcus fuscideae]|uniref:S-acyltransferase n=1 Tax=Apatococcus fuscideae TaxID=2026836 RepID=A0AAW1SI07_9CHLO